MSQHSGLVIGNVALDFHDELPDFLAFLFKEGAVETTHSAEGNQTEYEDDEGYTRLVASREDAIRQMDVRGFTIPFFAEIYADLVPYARPHLGAELQSELTGSKRYSDIEARTAIELLMEAPDTGKPVDDLYDFIGFMRDFLTVPFDEHRRPYYRHYSGYEQMSPELQDHFENYRVQRAGEHLRFFLPLVHVEEGESSDWTTLHNIRTYLFQDIGSLTKSRAQILTILNGMMYQNHPGLVPLMYVRLMLETVSPGSQVIWDLSQWIEDGYDLDALEEDINAAAPNMFEEAEFQYRIARRLKEQGPLGQTMLNVLEEMKALPSGKKSAARYHVIIAELLEFIFDWCFGDWQVEFDMDGGRSRIDILCANVAEEGYLSELRTLLHAFTVPMECKNYRSSLGNAEFNQINDRMGKRTSRIGFLFCRRIVSESKMKQHQADRYFRFENFIILFDDQHVERMLRFRLVEDYEGIIDMIRDQINRISYRSRS